MMKFRFRWTPDGNPIAYADKQQAIGNIWTQPIAGGAPKQLTNWRPAPILSFDWSHDDKWLAYAESVLSSDVVLIKDIGR
jgi:Tol biopolymer transport system component